MAEGDVDVEQLQAELAAEKAKVAEFRGNNSSLSAELERFGGVTPEDAAEAAELKRQRDRKELVDSKDIEAALDVQEKKLVEDFERRYLALQGAHDELAASLRQVSVTSVLKTAGIEAGLRAEAVDDVVRTYEGQFVAEGGALTRMEDGQPVLSSKNAGQNESPAEFFEALSALKPFYFAPSGGGGVEGGSDTTKTGPGGVRVISRDQFRSGKFAQQIKDGTARVDGYTDDVVSTPEGEHGRAGTAGE